MEAADEARDEGEDDEHPRGRVEDREGEDRHAEVDEDVRLGHHRDALVGLRGEDPGVLGEVVPRVDGHDHAAEEDGDDTGELHRLGGEVGSPREGERERRLHEDEFGVVAHVQLWHTRGAKTHDE